MYYPFYTNVLYSILPVEVWTLIGIGQYVFPVIVLWKIRASFKSWLYLLLYPLFIYSWIPISFIGFLHRHDHEWSHTLHTRNIKFDEVLVPKMQNSDRNRWYSQKVVNAPHEGVKKNTIRKTKATADAAAFVLYWVFYQLN